MSDNKNATHPMWLLAVHEGRSNLVLTPCPGTKEVSLPDSLAQLKQAGVQAVVTAMPQSELENNQVADIGLECEKLGIEWYHQPIVDDKTPQQDFADSWPQTSIALHRILTEGGNVALHCKGGSGRTGILAAHLLSELNWSEDEIITAVQAFRPNAFTLQSHQRYLKSITD